MQKYFFSVRYYKDNTFSEIVGIQAGITHESVYVLHDRLNREQIIKHSNCNIQVEFLAFNNIN